MRLDENPPLVTIGIACFNAAQTIERALSSACAQDWPNTEVLIVDDCSTDASVAVIEAFASNCAFVRLIRHEINTGPAGARNTILKNAKGEFIAFFDDDDESFAARVSGQIQTLVEYESRGKHGPVLCYASGIRRYANGYDIELPAIGSQGEVIPNGTAVADYLLLYKRESGWFYGSGVPTCALLARAVTFAEVGGFDEGMRRVEDVDLAVRLAMRGASFIGTSKSLFIQYATIAQDKSPGKNLAAEQHLANKNKTYLTSIGRYYYAVHWPKLRYWHFKRRYGRFFLELILLLIRYPVAVTRHLFATGPKRIRHEKRMSGA